MLATLFDFPLEDRKKLIRWSDVATATQQHNGIVASDEERKVELMECLRVFTALREKRMAETPKNDLISLLAHSDQFKGMLPSQLLGNIALLLVAGNDTTTNTMTGGVLALNQYPEQYKKLKNDNNLIDNFVNETIRWQTPLAYMRRTAKVDVILNGKKIKAGEKLIMWYVSGNSDDEIFEDGDNFNIERKTSVLKKHLSFGFGIHRCIGKRLAELQLKILWQELLVRFDHIEVCGDPVKTRSNFIKGYSKLEVILHKS
jgi:cytochrome P450